VSGIETEIDGGQQERNKTPTRARAETRSIRSRQKKQRRRPENK